MLNNFIDLFMESAPWMMLGLLIAGLIKECIPADFLARHLGGKGFKTTIKAAFIGAPLPLCSCGVIPAALGLRRNGASKSATTAFLVATPETGVDSVSVSYALLGPFMAIIRPIAAIVSAIVAGLLVGKEEQLYEQHKAKEHANQSGNASCCASEKAPVVTESVKSSSCCASEKAAVATESVKSSSCCASEKASAATESVKSSCCAGEKASSASDSVLSSCCESEKITTAEPVVKHKSILSKLSSGVTFAATDLVRDISVWLLIGLFFAALVKTYVATDFLAQWGDSIWAMLAMVLISVPMYICATASTPIAAGLLMSGISPGAVLVFMMAGPATNVATLGVVYKELGNRALAAYLVGVIGMSLVFGALTNYLVAEYGFQVAPLSAMDHALLPNWLTIGSSVLLAALMAKVFWQKAQQRLFS
ncbi:SO_0444 family Cu/Zn efflux transporter [Motilimonas cestriensis]|uniref:SO_0444 family Cu/Zn efflux transporter n=1 Tax=Motilimonas cestriensis TaxID=2742685 RepID=A0ABS8W6S0_9GAMM|nr:SO_0444 family Cu/Zn efflux transporter [Motilimonas cestriensis]MCE2594676.1 SO_0444 family Cu/Zn efflux transporter [Motilimonas cestriensis]